MARLNPDASEVPDARDRAAPDTDDGNAAASRDDTDPAPFPAHLTAADPRAVRVRLSAASRLGDEPPVRVAPHPKTESGVLAQRQAVVDDAPTDARLTSSGHDRHVLVEGGSRTAVILGQVTVLVDGTSAREVLVDGFRFVVEIEADRIAALRERASRGRATGTQGGPLDVRAIIPGKVASVSVAPGDEVIAGQQLLVVEAMKMQNELRAPRDGTIDRVGVAPGVNIEVGDLLVVIS
jgi:biotin carboxyl carrier protein